VQCVDSATNAMTDSKFSIMVTGNRGLQGPTAFLMSGGATPTVDAPYSWIGNPLAAQKITHVATGVYDVLLGTGNTPRAAKLVTANWESAGAKCVDAKAISGGLEVRCYGATGVPADLEFSVVQVAGGRPGKRVGFARALLTATASYTPDPSVSFSSSGGTITATRIGVGQYGMVFAGLGAPSPRGEHVQVSAVIDGISATCKPTAWQTTPSNDLSITIECRNRTGQFIDARYDVLAIE
jgi:hypothetical protein